MTCDFTDSVRKVLAMARAEATRLQHDQIGVEHILVALLREDSGATAAVFHQLGVDPASLRTRLEGTARPGRTAVLVAGVRYTSRAWQTLLAARKEAEKRGHSAIEIEHVLLAVCKRRKGKIADLISSLGASPEQVRDAVSGLLRAREVAVTGASTETRPQPRTGQPIVVEVLKHVVPHLPSIIVALAVLIIALAVVLGEARVDVATAMAFLTNVWIRLRSPAPEHGRHGMDGPTSSPNA